MDAKKARVIGEEGLPPSNKLLSNHEVYYIRANSVVQNKPFTFNSIKVFSEGLHYGYTICSVDEKENLTIGIMSKSTKDSNMWEAKGNSRLFDNSQESALMFQKTFKK